MNETIEQLYGPVLDDLENTIVGAGIRLVDDDPLDNAYGCTLSSLRLALHTATAIRLLLHEREKNRQQEPLAPLMGGEYENFLT